MGVYTLKIREQDTTLVRDSDELVNFNVEKIIREVRSLGEIQFDYPKTDPTSGPGVGQDADIQMLREVQVFRNGATIPYKWGVITDRKSASDDIARHVTAPGLGWWLGKRRIGKPLTSYLTNGSFNTNLTGWTASAGVTATHVATPARRGGGAARLVQGNTWGDEHLGQIIQDVDGGDIGLLLILAGWYRVEDWTGPAFESRGLFIEGRNQATDLRSYTYFEIDDTVQDSLGIWQYAQTKLWIPPGELWDLNPRAYAPDATMEWDELVLVAMESLAIPPAGEDIAATAERIIVHIQASPKSDLYWDTDCPDAGVTLYYPKAWQYIDRVKADTAINQELAPLGFDWGFEHPDDTTKVFTTYAPRQGVDRTTGGGAVTLLYRPGDRASNIAHHTFDESVQYTVNDWTEQGEGEGPAREEGYAVDTADLDGIVLEDVAAAPTGATTEMLDPLADSRLARTKTISELPTVTTHEGVDALIDVLGEGDIVNVIIDDGGVQVNTQMRIFRLELTCKNDTLALKVGPTEADLPPTEEQLLERLLWRIENRERSGRALERPTTIEEALLSQDGPVTAATSNRWPITTGGQIVLVIAELTAGQTAGADIDVEIHSAQQGLLGTVTIPAGDGAQKAYLGNWRIAPSDSLWGVILANDTAEGLTVKIRMKG